mgnify:FL=1
MAVCLDYQIVSTRRETLRDLQLQLAAAMVLLVVLIFKIWIKVQVTDLGYELARGKRQAVNLDMQLRELELEQSYVLRSDNLALAAERRLGLVALDPNRAFTLVLPHE